MHALGVAALVFACVSGGALGGMAVRALLPAHHLAKQTEDVVKLGMGMVATLTALVIGLLVASARSAFDTKDTELREFSANLILLDRQLAHYGPPTRETRALLRRYAVLQIDAAWPDEAGRPLGDGNAW